MTHPPRRSGLRRVPVQARSQARVEQILEAARALLIEGGPGALKPTDVARRAGVPVGSVYQYFEDRQGLLTVLVHRYFDRVHELLSRALEAASSLGEVVEALDDAASDWVALHRGDPSFAPLLHAIMGDPELQSANLADSHRNAALIAEGVLRHAPHLPREEVHRTALVVNHLFVPALQLALAADDEAEQQALIATWSRIAQDALLARLGPGSQGAP